jgi:predicted dithiol-disulfide oxidoreductase (DUF899 family)
MYGPEYDAGCPVCSAAADTFEGAVVHLNHRDVTFLCTSRAPLEKLQAYKQRMGWSFPRVSAFRSDFNFDFGVSFTKEQQREGIEYNYRKVDVAPVLEAGANSPLAEIAASSGTDPAGYMTEAHGLSAFALSDGDVYHTYSTYARGPEFLLGFYAILDRAPKGRNEDDDSEGSRPGRGRSPGHLVRSPRRVRGSHGAGDPMSRPAHSRATQIEIALVAESAPTDQSAVSEPQCRPRFAAPARSVERCVLNPQMRPRLALGLAPRAFNPLETTGRRSRKPRRTPAGNGVIGDTFWLVSSTAAAPATYATSKRTPRAREGRPHLRPEGLLDDRGAAPAADRGDDRSRLPRQRDVRPIKAV